MLLVACTFCLTRTMFLEREVTLFGSWLNSLFWGLWGSHTELPAEHLAGEEAGGISLLYWEAEQCSSGLKYFVFVLLLSLY